MRHRDPYNATSARAFPLKSALNAVPRPLRSIIRAAGSMPGCARLESMMVSGKMPAVAMAAPSVCAKRWPETARSFSIGIAAAVATSVPPAMARAMPANVPDREKIRVYSTILKSMRPTERTERRSCSQSTTVRSGISDRVRNRASAADEKAPAMPEAAP